MKIDATGKPVAVRNTSSAGRSSAPSTATSSSSGGGRVEINPLASRMASLEQSIQQHPAVDSQKIEAIKAAISSGNFSINADAIADGLISSARELIGRRG